MRKGSRCAWQYDGMLYVTAILQPPCLGVRALAISHACVCGARPWFFPRKKATQ